MDALYGGIFINCLFLSSHYVVDINCSLVEVTLDIHSETRCFWNGETEVECNSSGDATKTNQETPHGIDTLKVVNRRGSNDGILVSSGNNESN
jgi:hypothetical protein